MNVLKYFRLPVKLSARFEYFFLFCSWIFFLWNYCTGIEEGKCRISIGLRKLYIQKVPLNGTESYKMTHHYNFPGKKTKKQQQKFYFENKNDGVCLKNEI